MVVCVFKENVGGREAARRQARLRAAAKTPAGAERPRSLRDWSRKSGWVVERVAVHHVKLASVWRLRYNIQAVYGSACAMLKVSLTRRGIE